jgi:hypothetical protein
VAQLVAQMLLVISYTPNTEAVHLHWTALYHIQGSNYLTENCLFGYSIYKEEYIMFNVMKNKIKKRIYLVCGILHVLNTIALKMKKKRKLSVEEVQGLNSVMKASLSGYFVLIAIKTAKCHQRGGFF